MEFFTKLEDCAAEQISGGRGRGRGIGQQVSSTIRFNREVVAPFFGVQNPNKVFKSGIIPVDFPGGEFGPNDNNRSTDTFGEGVANAIANTDR